MTSKFKELMEQARSWQEEAPAVESPEKAAEEKGARSSEEAIAKAVSMPPAESHPPATTDPIGLDQAPQASTEGEAKRRGRPRGKRSHPDFEQVSAYISRRTHLSVKIALLHEGQGREFSELVEELLNDWLKR